MSLNLGDGPLTWPAVPGGLPGGMSGGLGEAWHMVRRGPLTWPAMPGGLPA